MRFIEPLVILSKLSREKMKWIVVNFTKYAVVAYCVKDFFLITWRILLPFTIPTDHFVGSLLQCRLYTCSTCMLQ